MSISFHDNKSGYLFIMTEGNSTSNHILLNGIFEHPLIRWCEQFGDKDKIFLVIGAHMGTYSICLSKYFKEIHAFECQRMTYLMLCGGVALNFKLNVHPHQIALGSKECEMNLHKISPDGGGSTLLERECKDIEVVKVRTLDSFRIKNVGFIKIDVEGFEREVILGALETLKNSGYPKIIFESWDDEQRSDLFETINEIGYKVVPIKGYKEMFLAEFENNPVL